MNDTGTSMSDIRPPLPSRRRVETKRIEHMKGLNTKKTTIGGHLIENSEDVYDMPDEDQKTSVAMNTDDCIDDYLNPIQSQVVNETRKHGSDYGALTIGKILVIIIIIAFLWVLWSSTTAATSTSPDSVTPKSESKCTSIILEEVNNIKQKVERLELRIKDLTNQLLNKTDMVINETRKHGSDYGALTIGIILVLIILAACPWVLWSSTTAATSTSPDSVTPKSESKCTSIILEEVNNIKQKVESLELRIKDLTNQLLNKTDMVKTLSDKID